ncbi:DUF4422 domain-containing protein [Algoriphagus mannitolivorans]|uniref:DUF4422 domain-containing protein n=1 Tax=Algoriphagus mannitolivorans TaxID=226504 RepID=UPI00040D5CAE|nr:DUF4422 domain-containing protein [Algoriphagus mannitolivorans]
MKAHIYTMYYKPGRILPLGDFYQPLFCGQFAGKSKLIGLKDDQGENISDRNEFYSELTGTYWAWKNTQQEIVGVCHYRRYFTAQPEPWYLKLKYFITHPFKIQKGPNPLIYTNNVEKYIPKILTEAEAKEILDVHDIVLPTARRFRYSIRTHYSKYHDIRDMEIVTEILKEKFPEYLNSWEKVLSGNVLYANNMFILKNDLFQKFMDWWFEMLFEFEKRENLESYQGYQRRILGFVAERLLTLWVIHNELKIKELKLIYFKKFKSH